MASLTNFRGLQILDGGTPQPGGAAISDNFALLVSWRPKCEWDKTVAPTANDDVGDDYYPGSLWLYVSGGTTYLMICTNNAAGAAVWREIKSWT